MPYNVTTYIFRSFINWVSYVAVFFKSIFLKTSLFEMKCAVLLSQWYWLSVVTQLTTSISSWSFSLISAWSAILNNKIKLHYAHSFTVAIKTHLALATVILSHNRWWIAKRKLLKWLSRFRFSESFTLSASSRWNGFRWESSRFWRSIRASLFTSSMLVADASFRTCVHKGREWTQHHIVGLQPIHSNTTH